MKLHFSSQKFRKTIAGLFLFLTFFSVGVGALTVKPEPAKAGLWFDLLQDAKEEALAVARDTIKTAILFAVYQTISFYVSGGIGEKPLFITDFDEWLVGNVDLTISTWLNETWENGFTLLCSGIDPNITLYLLSGYDPQSKYKTPPCSLSDIQRSFQNKGNEWSDFTLSLQGANSDTGFLFTIQDQALEKAANLKNQAAVEATVGKGFISKNPDGTIKTPGSVIENIFSSYATSSIGVIQNSTSTSTGQAIVSAAFAGVWDGLLLRGIDWIQK